jgi:CRP/FNR family transcriptional regulator, cyclic AMP receptor protein
MLGVVVQMAIATMTAKSSPSLEKFPLFDGLTATQLDKIKGYMRQRVYAAGTNLMTMEQPGEVIYFVVRGAVKVEAVQPDGSVVILALLRPGEIVGEMSLLDGMGRSASVIALEETAVYWMTSVSFMECLQTIPHLNYNLNLIMARRLRFTSMQLQSISTQNIYGRLARLLVWLAEDNNPEMKCREKATIPFRLTQAELGNLVGATRVHVNQALNNYRQRGLITMDGSRITILDVPEMMRRAGW